MFNIGGGELIVILLIALIVLGPQRLPEAARQVGKVMTDLRRLSSGFQNEVRSALDTADDPDRVSARRNPLAKEVPAEPTDERPPAAQPVRAEPLVAGPPLEPRGEAAPPPTRLSAQARAAARKSPTSDIPAAEEAASAKDTPATNGTAVEGGTQQASTPEPADEASTPSTQT